MTQEVSKYNTMATGLLSLSLYVCSWTVQDRGGGHIISSACTQRDRERRAAALLPCDKGSSTPGALSSASSRRSRNVNESERSSC